MPGAIRSRRLVLRKAFELVVVRYAFALVMVAAALGLRKLLEPITGTGAPFVVFFAAVTVTAIFAGPGPGICATLLSVPIGAYTFVVRAGHASSQAATQAALFAIDGLVIVYLSFMVTRARRGAEGIGGPAARAHRARSRRVLPRRPHRSLHGRQPGRLPDARPQAMKS